jgi:ribonuclease D
MTAQEFEQHIQQQIDDASYIDSDQALAIACQQWAKSNVLALDTEFIRTDTFYPIGALIQLADGEQCYLIDPLRIDDFSPMVELLVNPNIIKLLHSCSEDLEVFDRLFGVLPTPLIDTQVASGLDGLGFSLGYQGMTEKLLQIHVPKGETRSNWLQRPLTESQLHYAVLDVAYMPAMYQKLSTSLQQKGRWSWLQDECQQMLDNYANRDAVSQYFKKVKSAWKLSAAELAVLQQLTGWREELARELDKPRGRILKDRSCFDIARLRPKTLNDLAAIDEVGHGTVRKYGDQVLALLETASAIPQQQWPARMPKPLPPATGTILKRLKVGVRAKAEQLDLAPELLVKKRDYEELLRSGFDGADYVLPQSLAGWRKSVIGDELLAILTAEVTK